MKGHRENPQEEQEQIEEIDDLEIEEDMEETGTAEKVAEGKKHTVYMPRLQSMDKFLMAHYKDYILQELNKRLVSGELSKVADAVIVSEHIESGDCCFRHFDYWRLNQTDLMIQMEVRIQLNVRIDDFIDADSKWFYVQLWFSFAEDELQCEFDGIGLLFNKPEFDDHIKLDKYLVPVLRRDEIDKYTEDLWLRIDPEAYRDPIKRNAYTLKGKMGLSLMRVKLYQQSRVGAILFFRQGKVLVLPESECGKHCEEQPVEMPVPPNTIVLNTVAVRQGFEDLRIYHECIHYEWHYMFYRLQDMASTDTRQIKTVRVTTTLGGSFKSALSFIEHQASYGSYGLMMPETFMRTYINQRLAEAHDKRGDNGYFNHIGWQLEGIARSLASAYDLKKAAVRARMLQLGYVAARGILNYVDGRYILPFAFSLHEDASVNETYVIGRKQIAQLYRTDKEFRQIMDTGLFAFVDGHLVYAAGNDIVQTAVGARLSGWANAHMDQVALRFTRTYTADHEMVYTFGQMNSREAIENSFRFLGLDGNMTMKEKQARVDQILQEMPLSFHGALTCAMKGVATTQELAGRLHMSRETISRLRTKERKQYDLDLVVAICVALHLNPVVSIALLQRAGLSVQSYGPKAQYGMIINSLYDCSIEEVQDFLKDNDYPLLAISADEEEAV